MREAAFSYANLTNVSFLEDLYKQYKEDPSLLDPSWGYFFSGMDFSKGGSVTEVIQGDLAVFRLIDAYRRHGHKKAFSSPLLEQKKQVEELALSQFGLEKKGKEELFYSFGLLGDKKVPLAQILETLEKIYCGSVGFEFLEVKEDLQSWILSQIEGKGLLSALSKEEKETLLEDLTSAELFESFVHTKYPGQTRFSLEGGETLIPLLTFLIQSGARLGVQEILIGMAHRGRLNVLVNVLKKSYLEVFKEFEDTAEIEGSGDVKYHKGAHANLQMKDGSFIEVALMPNPSHLESVDPVVEGEVRAKQDLKKDALQEKVVPLLIHGDASIAGQGVIYELLQMGRLEGYKTGGTIHIVVNNHIGYTTVPKESRSTLYCTDIAKTFGCPVFHINSENPEECVAVIALAMQIRQKFHMDVFIDLACYRKYGHNEGDEPTFTQPLEYKKIRAKKSIRELFKAQLLQEGVISQEKAKQDEEAFKEKLKEIQKTALAFTKESKPVVRSLSLLKSEVPALSEKEILSLAEKICQIPKDFHIHPKLQRLIQERLKMVQSKECIIDWGMGEHLAYASLVFEKVHVRLSGQDVGRGTFSHRHSVWMDQETGNQYIPLTQVDPNQAPFSVYNSFLSEFAVMGFDLGYSLAYPKSLVIWEAQFGDFANGAQVIIDQYLATSEQKWARRSNMTLLLPHGYEGKGPEHSSARIERFLQLCAEDNLIIANCTTPSQFFHLLRRQAYLFEKRPLVVFTPKVLLRHPVCVSSLAQFVLDKFQEVLEDPTPPSSPEKVFFCSGKVFYDLLEEREKGQGKSCLIIRLEQIYPFPEKEIQAILQKYQTVKEFFWVQEEHKNMGAWSFVQTRMQELLKKPLFYIGREESASPAAGSYELHKKQVKLFMQQAFKE